MADLPDLHRFPTDPWRQRLRRRFFLLLWRVQPFLETASKRALDVVLALWLLALTAPLFILAAIACKVVNGKVFDKTVMYDRDGHSFPLRRFAIHRGDTSRPHPWLAWLAWGEIYRLPILLNVLAGHMSFVGPLPQEVGTHPPPEYMRHRVRPGITNFYVLRRAANIAHEGKQAADREYIHTSSLKADAGIIARSLVLPLLSMGKDVKTPDIINLLDIQIANMEMSEAVEAITAFAEGKQTVNIAFVNPHCLNIACENPEYKRVLQQSPLVLPDGIGIHYACRMGRMALRGNVNGTDMFPFLCEAAARKQLPIYFLGGSPGVPDALVDWVRTRYPRLPIAGWHHGYFSTEEEPHIIRDIAQSGARILLVAFGVPKQELWIQHHLHELGVGAAIGVGGLFDFYSGRIPRAPRWMREIGLEWVYRLMQEPGRMWRRYIIGNPLFLYRVWRWRRMHGYERSKT